MNKSTTPVLVTLKSYTRNERGEKEDTIELICRGKMRAVSDGYLLRYTEVQTDEDTGENISQDVMMQLQKSRVSMTRMGDFGTTMVFVKDTRFESDYHTPYGDLRMALYALQVQTDLHDDRGHVHLEYQLDVQGNHTGVQCVDLSYCKAGVRP